MENIAAKSLARIQKLILALSGPLNLSTHLKYILETITELNSASYGLILLYNPVSASLEAMAHVGFNPATLKIMSRIRATPNAGACGMAYINKKRAILEDLEKYPRFNCYRDIAANEMFSAVHSTPLLGRSGESLGVLSLYFMKAHKPSAHEIQLADMCARQAAHVIEETKAEKNLQDSEQRFRTMADNAPIMVWVTDPNGFCTFLSKTWYDFTGQTPETALGFGWLKAIDPEDREDIEKLYRDSSEKQKAFQLEYRLCHQKNEYRRVLDAVAPWFGLSGEFLGYIGAVMDISVRMNHQQSTQEIDNKLEERVKARTAQLETQAYRLRALADQIVTTEQRERKRIAAILHDHLQQILVASTFQLVEASRSIENKEFEKVAYSLDRSKEFLKEAIRSARTLTTELRPPVLYEDGLATAFEWLAQKFKNEHDLETVLNMDDARIPLSDSLKIMIFESVKELLFNIVKHAKTSQAQLTLKFIFNHILYICVEDQGVGFKTNYQENGFSSHGGGLGLFGMRERLKLLNAEFNLTSSPDQGTKIEIRIPIEPFVIKEETELLQQKIVAQKEIAAQSSKAKTIKILLADDHKIVREGIANILKDNPLFQVVGQAENGYDAIEKTASFLPDVIIMDINMPKLSGIEATRLIKKNFPHIHIIGLSVQDENNVADAMKKAGAHTLLNKTGDPEKLIDAILNCIKLSVPEKKHLTMLPVIINT